MAQPLGKNSNQQITDARNQYNITSKRRDFAANSNYAPTYPTVSGEFNQKYERGGITNVIAIPKKGEVEDSSTQNPGTFGQKQKGRRVRSDKQYLQNSETKSTPNQSLSKKSKLLPKVLSLQNVAKVKNAAAARGQVGFALTWTGLLNAIAFPLGLLSFGAFAAAAAVYWVADLASTVPGGEAALTAVTKVPFWVMGTGDIDVSVLGIGLYILYIFLIITMFAGAYLQLKLGGLEPIGGKASGLKSLTLIAVFVISAVPASTFIPWIFIWLFVVMIYPN